MYLYNFTLQRATGITHAVHGSFAGGKQQEILLAKGKSLELVRPDSNTGKVHTLLQTEIFGVVRSLMSFRLTGGTKGENGLIWRDHIREEAHLASPVSEPFKRITGENSNQVPRANLQFLMSLLKRSDRTRFELKLEQTVTAPETDFCEEFHCEKV